MRIHYRAFAATTLMLMGSLVGNAHAEAIGTVTEGVHEKVIINFRFDPVVGSPTALHWGLGGIGPGAGSFCKVTLFAGGFPISSVTTSHNLTCQGSWSATSSSAGSVTIDLNVDLRGLAAGQPGRIEFVPLFDPGEWVTFGTPGFFFAGGGSLAELSTEIVALPAVDGPATLPLMAMGLVAIAAYRRRRG